MVKAEENKFTLQPCLGVICPGKLLMYIQPSQLSQVQRVDAI